MCCHHAQAEQRSNKHVKITDRSYRAGVSTYPLIEPIFACRRRCSASSFYFGFLLFLLLSSSPVAATTTRMLTQHIVATITTERGRAAASAVVVFAIRAKTHTQRVGQTATRGTTTSRRRGAASQNVAVAGDLRSSSSISSLSPGSDGGGGAAAAAPFLRWTTRRPLDTAGGERRGVIGSDGAFAGQEYVDCVAREPLFHRDGTIGHDHLGGLRRVPRGWGGAASVRIGPRFFRAAPAAGAQTVVVHASAAPAMYLSACVVGCVDSAWLKLSFFDGQGRPFSRDEWLRACAAEAPRMVPVKAADERRASEAVADEAAAAGVDDGLGRHSSHESRIALSLAGGTLRAELRARGPRLHWSRLRVGATPTAVGWSGCGSDLDAGGGGGVRLSRPQQLTGGGDGMKSIQQGHRQQQGGQQSTIRPMRWSR